VLDDRTYTKSEQNTTVKPKNQLPGLLERTLSANIENSGNSFAESESSEETLSYSQ